MAVKPVILALSRSGEPVAHKLASLLDASVHGREGRVDQADAFFANALDHMRSLFASGTPVIGVCAAGILIRAVAPLLSDKRKEPPVVAVSDDGGMVVPLLGGHHGANRLARQIAKELCGKAAVTTAGDVALGVSLDEPPAGYVLANPEDAKDVMARLLAGEGAQISGPALFDIASDPEGAVHLIVTEKPQATASNCLVYHPKRFVLGLGAARGAEPDEMWGLARQVLDQAGIAPGAVACVTSVDLKADEAAILSVASRLGVPFRHFTAAALEAEASRLETPSDVVFAEIGCHGVAEGAALAAVGPTGQLCVAKQKTVMCTAALAESPSVIVELAGHPRGRLSVIGIGPGQSEWRTPEASRLVAEADLLVGYGLYIDLLGPLAAGKPRADFPLGGEEARCRHALEEAGKGRNVALICSGDAGIYAMGALVFELMDRAPDAGGVTPEAARVEVVSAPGVSALQAAAARAGAPLGHDFCAISLSDLLTPREDIMKRIKAAAAGDFVIAFYNPVSRRRRTLLAEARDILLPFRRPGTPVLLASSLGRPKENIRFRALADLDVDEVDMLTVVLVGSSHSRLAALGEGPRMYTPRGYARKIDGDLAE